MDCLIFSKFIVNKLQCQTYFVNKQKKRKKLLCSILVNLKTKHTMVNLTDLITNKSKMCCASFF